LFVVILLVVGFGTDFAVYKAANLFANLWPFR